MFEVNLNRKTKTSLRSIVFANPGCLAIRVLGSKFNELKDSVDFEKL